MVIYILSYRGFFVCERFFKFENSVFFKLIKIIRALGRTGKGDQLMVFLDNPEWGQDVMWAAGGRKGAESYFIFLSLPATTSLAPSPAPSG